MTDLVDFSSLPELVLVKIFAHIELQDLILNVSRTCKRFYMVVDGNSVLWRHFSVDCAVEAEEGHLSKILRHSISFLEFLIPYASLNVSVSAIDFHLTTGLCNAKQLYWLDLSGCKLSTLSFLQFMPNVEILNVSECTNLIDADFDVITNLNNLNQLFVSFTNVKPETIIRICESSTLTVLDTSGIPLNIEQCARVLTTELLFFYLTLERDDEEPFLHGLVRNFRSLSIHICRNHVV